MQKIEIFLMKKTGSRVISWRRHIDDIFAVADPDDLDGKIYLFAINFNESDTQLPFYILDHREVS